MKYNSIGQQLIAKAKELDPSYKPDKFNDMSEALNIILNNIEINGSNFQIIDVTSSSKNNSISSLYNEITQVVDAEPPTFSNQSEIYNNIATAVNDGLVPILKFTDGYGYYKEYLSSSSEYVFSINHFILNSDDTRSNIVITLRVGNTTNSKYYVNLFKIPYTIVIQEAFSDSGSINNLDEMLSVLSGVATTSFGKIGGLFLYNVAEKQLYNIYSLNPQATGSDAMLEAYTIINNKIVYIKFTAGQGRYDYTKTTYALGGGGGGSDTVVIDIGTISEELTGTLSSDVLSKINSAISENKNIVIKVSSDGTNIFLPNVIYAAGDIVVAIGFMSGGGEQIYSATITIDLSNGQYTLVEFEISGGSATKMINLGTLSDSGTLDTDKLQELITLFQNGDLIQATFVLNGAQFITASAYSNGSSMGIVAYTVVAELDSAVIVDVSINTANGNYTITPFVIPDSFKTINYSSLIGKGNINLQEPLVSGTNIKTINRQSLLGSGNINVQVPLISGENIKTINNESILGAGYIITGLPAKTYSISGISFTKFEKGQTTTISTSDSAIIQSALSNNAAVLYDENLKSYLPMICVDSISNIQILYSDRKGNCGIVQISLPMYTAKISMVFNTAPYATENGIHDLFEYELPLTTEKSTELWTNVGTAIQTFYNSSKTESDKETLKEALSIGFGIPFCYLLKVNFIGKYNSYLDNVVNNLTNSSISSDEISQALSYTNQINDIITAIGNDAILTPSSQRMQLETLVNQFCNSLGWSCDKNATFYTIKDNAGTTLIQFNIISKAFPTKATITTETLSVFMDDLYNDLRNKI